MFEKTLETILKKYLAPYIDGISKEGLSILKGDLQLHNLKIKAEAFDFLKPFGVLLKSGQVARLHIQIPWRQLTQGKIAIELEGISVSVARIQGDVPSDATILMENWQSKVGKVEKKMQELQELAESTGDEQAGYVGRWMHRLAQNIQFSVSGGIMLQASDTKQALGGGLLLDGLRVTSLGEADPDPKVVCLQKQVEISNIAAYATVDDGMPHYILEPTRLILTVKHRDSDLQAKLEMLEGRGDGRKAATGCRIALSQRGLFKLAVSMREMGAWSTHCQEVVARHCMHIKTDSNSLQGETYQAYIKLYRRRQQGKDQALNPQEEDALQAIEEAVMSRHLARWRLEVNEALQTMQQTTRRGWRGFLGRGRQELVEPDEWEQLQSKIRDDQAYLADLDRPTSMAVSIEISQICLQLYSDVDLLDQSAPRSFQTISESGIPHDQLTYDELVSGLGAFDRDATVKHDVRLILSQPLTSAQVTPRVVADYERSEWSFGLCFGTMEVWCDQENVLRYTSTETKRMVGINLEPKQFKDVALWSKICDDGTELISANICLPPIQLCTSPMMLSVSLALATMELPDPPDFGNNQPDEEDGFHDSDWNLHGNYWQEWNDDFKRWKQDVVLEAAGKQAERAKESALVFDVNLDIAAPQLTVKVAGARRLHLDLGRLRFKSDGVMKADDFKAKVELSDTQISVVTDAGGSEQRLPLLEPINLTVLLAGKKPKGKADAPMELDIDLDLHSIQMGIYPKAIHVILDAPTKYMAALDQAADTKDPAAQRKSRRGSAILEQCHKKAEAAAVAASHAGKEAAAKTTTAAAAAQSEYSVKARAVIQLISLGLYDLESKAVARIEMASLSASVSALPSKAITGGASMQHLLIEAMKRPLLQLRDSGVGEALSVKLSTQADHPTTVSLKVCPLLVEWRKDSVRQLVEVAASCSPPSGGQQASAKDHLAEAALDQISQAIEAKVRERRASSSGLKRVSFVPPPARKSVRSVPADDPSRAVAMEGLSVEGALPKLAAEAPGGKEGISQSLDVSVQFGGLLIKLYREEHERREVIPFWLARSGGPLVEWHAVGMTAKYEAFSNGEARVKLALDSFSVLYDGHCIMSPWDTGNHLFECNLKLYVPVENGGPLHSVCFQGMLRKLSIVFFKKHIDSLTFYLSSSVAGALAQKTAGDVKEAMEKPKSAENVALWNFFVESPIIYLSRDESLLQYSPAWQGDVVLPSPVGHAPEEKEESDGDEFEDAEEHPTPMVEELHQYIIVCPGSVTAKNTFKADGTDNPPLLCSVAFSQTTIEAKDKFGPATGTFLKIDNWALSVRLDSATALQVMHVSIGLDFQPISCDLNPERMTLVLDCLQEDVLYKGYFPEPPEEVPEGLTPSGGGPSFADSTSEDNRVQNMVANVRITFGGLNVKLSKLAGCGPDGQPSYEPLLGLVIGTLRLMVDCVLYYGGVPPALQLGVFLDSVVADDLRPEKSRGHVLSTRLLELQTGGNLLSTDQADNWIAVPDREQGKVPYKPQKAALQLVFTVASATNSKVRLVLQQPKVFTLLKVLQDAGDALSGGFAKSTMASYPPPPVPPSSAAVAAAPESAETNLNVCLSIQEASLSLYTNYKSVHAPVVQVIVSLTTELDVGKSSIKIRDVALSDLHVSRSEAQPEAEPGSPSHQGSKAVHSSVKLFTLRSLHVSGEQRQLPRPELELEVRAHPASVRLTTGDAPHLVAALTGLGGDSPLKDAQQPKEQEAHQEDAEAPAVEPTASRMGMLRLLVRGIEGAQSLDGVWITAHIGEKCAPARIPWNQSTFLPVPAVQSAGAHQLAASGPQLQLALQCQSGENLATMTLPVELCAGRGLDGCRVLLQPQPLPEELAKALGLSAAADRGSLQLNLQAKYELGPSAGAVAAGLAALCAPSDSVEEFLKPCEQLQDFLQEPVPRLHGSSDSSLNKAKSRKSMRASLKRRTLVLPKPANAGASKAAATPLAIRVQVFLDGFEASFLDDCQANVLPVLRLRLRAGNGSEASGSSSSSSQAARNRASMIKFEMNPWVAKEQRLGMSAGMENYFIGVNYLNARAGCWEPFLEPWAADFFVSAYKGLPPGQGQTSSKAAPDNPALSAKYNAETEITLMSFGPLNINVTPQLCSLASFLLSNKEAYLQRLNEPGTAVEGAGGARYRLLNLASAPVCLAVLQPGLSAAANNTALDWRVFEPCNEEVPLDPLLGRRSAEEWRQLADETLACLVGLLPPGGSGGAPREPLQVLLSSTSDGLVPVPGAKAAQHAACEVLLPHPSHHLLLISGRLRVFNHTQHALEVRFRPGGDAQAASATPMHVLPDRLAYPPQIAALRPGAEDEAAPSLAPIRMESTTPKAVEETGVVPGVPDAQRLPPQHFCSAPLACAEADAAVDVRLAGAGSWSDAVQFGAGASAEDVRGKALFVPADQGALMCLRAYCCRSAPGAGGATALHICAPLRLVNASPVRLRFSFRLEGDSSHGPISMEVDPFSECDVSSDLDPAQPFSLSLSLADGRLSASAPGKASSPSSPENAESPAVHGIFDPSQQETVVPVPVARAEDDGSSPSLGITVTHGLAVRASCSRWLVDRTGLGLRALCGSLIEVTAAGANLLLPQVDGHITLLDHLLGEEPRSASRRPTKKHQHEKGYCLAVPGEEGSWSSLAAVKLPDEDSSFTHATLGPGGEARSDGHRLHLCLQSEAVSSRLTHGAPCQVISVLPQVIIYNQMPDDALLVRAQGDSDTEVSIPAGQNGGFLRWNGDANATSGKSPLTVQFRPSKLAETCEWSMPINFGVGEATGPMSLALPLKGTSHSSRSSTRMEVRKSGDRGKTCALDLFTAEVAERGGAVCLTIKRGSRCELQNFSCLVDSVSLRPLHPEHGEEEFSARFCETVEVAWPTAAARGQLELCIAWSRAAGGGCSRQPAPDPRKPGQALYPAPGGWQAAVLETGFTGDVCWLRVQDAVQTSQQQSEKSQSSKGPGTANLKLVVTIAHVGLSLVSPKREQELLYAELRNVAALVGMWNSCLCLEFCAGGMQVDCQLLDYKDCPVVFCNKGEPALQCKVIQQLPACKSGVGLDALAISINALELSVNESFLSEVGEAVSDMLRPILSLEELGREQIEAWRTQPLGGPLQVPPPVPAQIDISEFTFMGLEVHLWASIRLATLPAALRGALGVLTVGSDRLSIQGATLQLDPEVFDNIHGPAPTVAKIILQRYWSNLLLSLASLLGRSTLLELPGLPVKWGRRGVEGGMTAINFLLTRTANVFEYCTLDKQYVRQKRPLLGRQVMEVTSLKTGVGAAGQHLAEGVMHVGDIIREPIEGARESGVKGFTKGVGRGVMGTIVQPVLGAVYSVHALSRGVAIAVSKDGEGASSQRHIAVRRRPPRVMYAAGAIREYVETQAAGVEQ